MEVFGKCSLYLAPFDEKFQEYDIYLSIYLNKCPHSFVLPNICVTLPKPSPHTACVYAEIMGTWLKLAWRESQETIPLFLHHTRLSSHGVAVCIDKGDNLKDPIFNTNTPIG